MIPIKACSQCGKQMFYMGKIGGVCWFYCRNCKKNEEAQYIQNVKQRFKPNVKVIDYR